MSWRQRYHYQVFLRSSIWVAPFLGLILALASFRVIGVVGRYMNWHSAMEADAARAVVSTLASALLTFIVFILSAILVAVQLASAQLTSRIIARSLQESAIRGSLAILVFSFTFSLAVLSRISGLAPWIELQISIWSSLLCVCVVLYLVDHLAKSLRPIAILTGVASEGAEVIRSVYPQALGEDEEPPASPPPVGSASQVINHSGQSSVLLAVNTEGLFQLALRSRVVLEIVPQVGDFVVHGAELIRVYGDAPIAARQLQEAFALGAERTLEQDPAFAFRIIVDIASKALSPAINDPTTGVLALDQLHLLLRLVGMQRLNNGCVRDAEGQPRLLYRTPNWEDFVHLGLTEIRQYGATSIQIARRMRALLEHLIKVLPAKRLAPLQEQLELLKRSVARSFPDPEDRLQAEVSDLQGLGGSASR